MLIESDLYLIYLAIVCMQIYSHQAKPSSQQKFTFWKSTMVFIVNFEQVSHIVLLFLLLTLNK